MSGRAFLHPDLRGGCSAQASRLSSAMRPRMHRPCIVRVPMSCPTMRDPCHQAAAEALLRLQSDVQRARRQCAAPAAPPLPLGQRCALRARLAVGRSRERMREAETEGKIKGAARSGLRSQSARGFGAAPRFQRWVLCRHTTPLGADACRVPCSIDCAAFLWRLSHGFA